MSDLILEWLQPACKIHPEVRLRAEPCEQSGCCVYHHPHICDKCVDEQATSDGLDAYRIALSGNGDIE